MLDFSQEGIEAFRGRFILFYLIIILFIVAVTSRLFYLQIIQGHEMRMLSSDYTIKELRLPAPRGVIFDRNKVVLVQSRPSFDLVMIRQYVKDFSRLKLSLEDILGLTPEFMDAKWVELRKQPAFYPLVLVPDAPLDIVGKIRVAQSVPTEPDDLDLRGVDILPKPLRDYPDVSASFLGYLTEISQKQLDEFESTEPGRYNVGDLIGVAGLERSWEKYLKGIDGYRQKIVDAVGHEVSSKDMIKYLKDQRPRPGAHLHLSIDNRLQKVAEAGFKNKAGALVALDTRTGGILALVSYPSYDPKALQGLSPSKWQELVQDPQKLFLNRAIQGAYPPGSTYKVVVAIAALSEGVVSPQEKVVCSGGLQFGGRFFRCWKSGGHGALSLVDAIAQSCDTYFYTMGIRLGVDRLAKYARLLGLGAPTGIDLLGEKGGLIPTAAWKEKLFKTPWQPGENLSIAIGQGYDTVTPLGNAVMMARVASGKELHPHLVEKVDNVLGETVWDSEKEPSPRSGSQDLPLQESVLKWVRRGLEQVVASPSGTAHRHWSPDFTMAAKTGTAQTVSSEAKSRGVRDEGDHALFIAYAPVDQPEIAVSVVVEHGGHGGTTAAPIAREVIAKYFELKKKKEGGQEQDAPHR